MNDVVIVESVRTPFGKRGGGMSTLHAIDVLGEVQRALFDRSRVNPADVGQVVGGCVGQVGMQAMNVTRNAWLTAGLPIEVPATTVDSQCGSSQQATTIAYSLVRSGMVDVAVACGVEMMSQVPMGSSVPQQPNVGKPVNKKYWAQHEFTSQFEGAERIAEKWGITRADCDQFGKRSQDLAAQAWREERFSTQIIPVGGISRDEGMRETTLEALGGLKPTGRPDGVHTAATSSQISDGAAAVLMMTSKRALELGVLPQAIIVDSCLVGCDPTLMLEGPIPATRKLLSNNGLGMDNIDVIEINEAFASVVLAWEREMKPDMDRVNLNGGAIALGHPLGATGVALMTKAVHELQRCQGEHALVTMCCGGGLGTGTLLRST
jgi:acetyl-CoA C-acetyltransferase